jgi:hypothetical protein
MHERWVAKAYMFLPKIDKDLIASEDPLNNGGLIIPLEERSSDVSEYTQSSYQKLRQDEESKPQINYFDPEANPAFKSFSENIPKKKLRRLISYNDRAYAVQKIFSLHSSKQYCSETLFTAVNIMDRYLTRVGYWNFPRLQLCLLATTATILAAKMNENYSPVIEYTLKFLADDE